MDAGIFRLDRRDFLFCGGEDGDVGGTLGAAHAEIDDLSIAHLADRGPFRIAVAHGGDIGQPHRSAVAQLDLALAQFIGGFGAAQDAHRLARAADLGRAARRVDIGLAQHLIDLARRDPIRLHPRQIEDHLDLAIDAREAIDLGHALDGEQPLGDRVVDEPAQLLDRHVVGLDGVDRQEAAGNLLLLHARFEDPVGQAAPDGVDRIRDLDRRVVGIGADLELYESVGIALARRGIERFDPVDRADRRFHPLGDLVFDLGRGGARLRDRDAHRGKFDVGIVDDIHLREAEDPRQKQRGERHKGDHRIADRPGGDIAKIHCVSRSDWCVPGISAPAAGERFRPRSGSPQRAIRCVRARSGRYR